MGRRALTKKQKVLNLLSNGKPVTWTALRNIRLRDYNDNRSSG